MTNNTEIKDFQNAKDTNNVNAYSFQVEDYFEAMLVKSFIDYIHKPNMATYQDFSSLLNSWSSFEHSTNEFALSLTSAKIHEMLKEKVIPGMVQEYKHENHCYNDDVVRIVKDIPPERGWIKLSLNSEIYLVRRTRDYFDIVRATDKLYDIESDSTVLGHTRLEINKIMRINTSTVEFIVTHPSESRQTWPRLTTDILIICKWAWKTYGTKFIN